MALRLAFLVLLGACGPVLSENAFCAGDICEADKSQGQEAADDDLMSMLALRQKTATWPKKKGLPDQMNSSMVWKDSRRRRRSVCANKQYQQCNADIATLLAQAQVDPSVSTQTQTLDFMAVSSSLLGMTTDVLGLLESFELATLSGGTLGVLALAADMASASFSLSSGGFTSCDARCLFAETAVFTKEFVEKEIESKHYDTLMTLITGAQYKLKEISHRIADGGVQWQNDDCVWSNLTGDADINAPPGQYWGPTPGATSLTYIGATSLCSLLGPSGCGGILCQEGTTAANALATCAVYRRLVAVDLPHANYTAHFPSTECFGSEPFNLTGAPNATVDRVLAQGGMVDQLLNDMSTQLVSTFTLGTHGFPGKPMPNSTVYAAVYASAYFQLYSRAIQTNDTVFHYEGERDRLVREIDDITTWVNASINESVHTRMSYIDVKYETKACPALGGTCYKGNDRFENTCWTVTSVPAAFNPADENDVQHCIDLHRGWVNTQQTTWWNLTQELVSHWQVIKSKVRSWRLPKGGAAPRSALTAP